MKTAHISLSTDGGFTWSEPIKVNQTPTNPENFRRSYAFLPSVAVAGDGSVAVTYYDFRNDDDTAELADYFAALCGGDCSDPGSWGDEVRLSEVSFDYRQAPVAGGLFLGDYEGLTSDGVVFMAAFGLPHNGDPASIFFRLFVP